MTTSTAYAVCDRLLDPETNRHCEFDGIVEVNVETGLWTCPACWAVRIGYEELRPGESLTRIRPTVIEGDIACPVCLSSGEEPCRRGRYQGDNLISGRDTRPSWHQSRVLINR